MVLCYRCGRYGHISPNCESARRRRRGSDEFYDSPGSWSDQESTDSEEWEDSEDSEDSGSAESTPSNTAGVYVLVLDNGTRYVGKSANVNRRISQHLNPKAADASSAWCKKGGTQRAYSEPPITEPNADLSVWEQNETVAQMIKHGCDRIRGWEFTSCQPFGPLEYELFKKLAFSGNDLCNPT